LFCFWLPVVTDVFEALKPDAPVLREDIADQKEGAHGPRRHPNHIFTWEQGDKAATEAVLAEADVVAEEMIVYPRTHPCPIETCGCVASMDKVNGKLTVWGTFQAPHAVRTVASLISGIAEHNIRIVSPDIGGGFGNKVGVYPGYVCSIVASIVTGKPVKWVEDRMENLMTTAFARDYAMQGKIAANRDGRITGLWCHVTANHGAFDSCADPTKFPAGFFNICTGSYDIPVAWLSVDSGRWSLDRELGLEECCDESAWARTCRLSTLADRTWRARPSRATRGQSGHTYHRCHQSD
jgi:carbon-monoxide dehydrogenase large subunit